MMVRPLGEDLEALEGTGVAHAVGHIPCQSTRITPLKWTFQLKQNMPAEFGTQEGIGDELYNSEKMDDEKMNKRHGNHEVISSSHPKV
jgi:hypothetical protein